MTRKKQRQASFIRCYEPRSSYRKLSTSHLVDAVDVKPHVGCARVQVGQLRRASTSSNAATAAAVLRGAVVGQPVHDGAVGAATWGYVLPYEPSYGQRAQGWGCQVHAATNDVTHPEAFACAVVVASATQHETKKKK